MQVNEEDDYYDGPSDPEYATDDSNGMMHKFLMSFKLSLVSRTASDIKGKLIQILSCFTSEGIICFWGDKLFKISLWVKARTKLEPRTSQKPMLLIYYH